jgi:signal transduction histidine kinase
MLDIYPMLANDIHKPSLKLSLRKEVVILSTIASIVLLGVTMLLYSSFNRQESLDAWVEHTQVVIQRGHVFLSHIVRLESISRGYVLTHNEQQRARSAGIVREIKSDLAALTRLTQDNPAQQKNLVDLNRLTKPRLALSQRVLDTAARHPGRLDLVSPLVSQGDETMASLQATLSNLIDEEERLLVNRRLAAREAFFQTRLFFTMGVFLVFLLLGACLYLMNREIQNRNIAEFKLTDLNVMLEEQLQRLQQEILERIKAEGKVSALNGELAEKVEGLNVANTTLNAVNKELEAFSYSVSHDLRAPLRSIDGFSQALLDFYNDKLDDTGKDYLARIRNNSQRMAQLIDDMLQLSRLTRDELHVEDINLSRIAEELSQELQTQQPDRHVECVIQPDMQTRADEHLMQALLQNLLANAWKFTSTHETAKIEFGSLLQEEKTVYYVRDDGAGFEMEFVHKLFGAFQRLHHMNEFPGTGIGLATAQRIIHRHGGQIWAEGAVNKGATFFFTVGNKTN